VPFIYHSVSNASGPHRYARDSNSCVYIILRETCDKCIPLRCIRCSRVYSFLYSPDRVICHGCVSAADHLEASRYIRLISPLPSVLPALLVNSSFIHRVYVLLFVQGRATLLIMDSVHLGLSHESSNV